MSGETEGSKSARPLHSINGLLLWIIYVFSAVGTGLALASFGSPWWLSVLGGFAWPAELLYWPMQLLHHAAAGT
jgi:hypothetical protein